MKKPDDATMASVRNVLADMHENNAFAIIAKAPVFGDLYCNADMRGALMGGMPLNLAAVAESPMFRMTPEQFENAIFKEAQKEYPGVQNHSLGLQAYFQMKESFPAIFHDPLAPEKKDTLMIFPIRSLDLFVVYAAEISMVREILQDHAAVNAKFLRIFKENPFVVAQGMTAEIAVDQRKMIEESLRVFKEQTGYPVKDALSAAFNRAFNEEKKKTAYAEECDMTAILAGRRGRITYKTRDFADVKDIALQARVALAADFKYRN